MLVKLRNDTTPRHDVGVASIASPPATVDSGTVVAPACTLYNYGNRNENYSVRMTIGPDYDTAISVTHVAGTKRAVVFPSWSVSYPPGFYAVTCSTELGTDTLHANDRMQDSVEVTPPPCVVDAEQAAGVARLLATPNPARRQISFQVTAAPGATVDVLRIFDAAGRGGNIFRGELGQEWGIERAEADNIGLIATVANSLMLRGVLKSRSLVDIRVMTAIPIETVAEPFIRLRAIRHLENGYIIVLAGGTGNPYVTTDYPSVQRALELRAEAILAAKNGIDGVYTADPHRDPSARRYKQINYDTVIQKNLRAMDQSAVLLARDHGLPIHVFDFDVPEIMCRICKGEDIGTLICRNGDLLAE